MPSSHSLFPSTASPWAHLLARTGLGNGASSLPSFGHKLVLERLSLNPIPFKPCCFRFLPCCHHFCLLVPLFMPFFLRHFLVNNCLFVFNNMVVELIAGE
ncbi:hypothetical protein PAXRUDRAFT_778618 [Paxillus rubicundulus Ve08.2h10]|uniref:Uncharacterized protein n=1 Tax=Paxillus rubicundulus Ve08.2h10 TaxID=930991 RepID=A0A0D0DR59_9AGAM|nr:hypothetical protein PAXRUDRAFT_778618 [Paxillus rubicundulus Ve08.2h10]